MSWSSAAGYLALCALAPALPGLSIRTRALLTGRRGAPVLQPYAELAKLLRKRAVYSATAGWIFRAAGVVSLAAALLAGLLLPLDGQRSLAALSGDFMLFAGLLALGRFALILAALDTGSSFEGMGASREAMIGTFAELALFLAFVALVLTTRETSLSGMLGAPLASQWAAALPSLVMIGISLFVLLLAESSRVPFDDPATHLELTMIHEVAALDHSGPELAVVLYGSYLKFALFAAVTVGVLAPRATLDAPAALLALVPALAVVAILVGVVEAAMARLRLNRIPQLLAAVAALAAFATILLLRHP